jgi:hypothetical protein
MPLREPGERRAERRTPSLRPDAALNLLENEYEIICGVRSCSSRSHFWDGGESTSRRQRGGWHALHAIFIFRWPVPASRGSLEIGDDLSSQATLPPLAVLARRHFGALHEPIRTCSRAVPCAFAPRRRSVPVRGRRRVFLRRGGAVCFCAAAALARACHGAPLRTATALSPLETEAAGSPFRYVRGARRCGRGRPWRRCGHRPSWRAVLRESA